MSTPATDKKSAGAVPELEPVHAVPATMRGQGRTFLGSVLAEDSPRLCPHPASAFSVRRADAPLMPSFDEEISMLSGSDSDDRSLSLSTRRLPEAARVLQPFFTPPAGGATTHFSRGVKGQTRRRERAHQDLEMNTGDGSLGIAKPQFSIFIDLSSADTLPYFPTILLDGMDDGHPPRLRLRRSSYARLVW